MSTGQTFVRTITRSPLIASVLYATVLVLLIVTAGLAISDVISRSGALAQTADLLEQLKGRKGRGAMPPLSSEHPGKPFLEGPTVTVAGAALLQRVASAITSVGGSVQSSQVDVSGSQGAQEGQVGLVVSCEMEQPALQKVLYDLETGMPFLYVDQLDVQVPQTTANSGAAGGRIRVVLSVSGRWEGAK